MLLSFPGYGNIEKSADPARFLKNYHAYMERAIGVPRRTITWTTLNEISEFQSRPT